MTSSQGGRPQETTRRFLHYKKGSADSSLYNLLPASKKRRIEDYKEIPKIAGWLNSGKEVVPRVESMFSQVLLCSSRSPSPNSIISGFVEA